VNLKRLFRRAPRTDQRAETVTVRLHHENGTVVVMRNVSRAMLAHMKRNLGRDQLYEHEHVTVNLKSFSIVELDATKNSMETGVETQVDE